MSENNSPQLLLLSSTDYSSEKVHEAEEAKTVPCPKVFDFKFLYGN